jgi:GTP cyclohydrolase FolE2
LVEVRIVARWPMRRTTPVTGLSTQEMVSLIGIAAATSAGARRVVGVEATGINACPCAQGLVRGLATERLLEAGFGDGDVERILELVPLATHNQRGRGTLYVGAVTDLDAEDLVEIVERSMSAPVYELLKRPDELFVVERAHLRPRFVADSVRIALREVLGALVADSVRLEGDHKGRPYRFFAKTAVAPSLDVIGSVHRGRVPWQEPVQRVKRQPGSATAWSTTDSYEVTGSRHRLWQSVPAGSSTFP